MKREVAIAAVAAAVAVFAAVGAALAPPAVAAPAPLAYSLEPADASFEEAAASCEDFGFFAADKKKECDESCKRGRKCQKKQVCGEGPCPDPGYCWKCG